MIGRHLLSGRRRRFADQLFQLCEFAGFLWGVGREIGRMPREEEVFVTFPLSSSRDAFNHKTDLVKRQIPE